MEKFRFYYQKFAAILLLAGALVAVIPILVLFAEVMIWRDTAGDSFLVTIWEFINTPWIE